MKASSCVGFCHMIELTHLIVLINYIQSRVNVGSGFYATWVEVVLLSQCIMN